jgi:uncharacterized membrane protein YfhO
MVSILLISVLFFNVAFMNLSLFAVRFGNPEILKTKQEDLIASYTNPTDMKMFADIRKSDLTFHRILWNNLYQYNAPMVYDYNGFSSYNSLLSGEVHNFIKNEYNVFQHNTPSLFRNLDNRLYLETALTNKYYIVPKSSDYQPYAYSRVKETDRYHVFQNNYALPIGFMYDKVVDKQTFDQLNVGQRDQLLLQAAVVEQSSETKSLPTFQTKNLEVKTVQVKQKDMQMTNVTLKDHRLTAKKKAEIVITHPFAKELGEVLVDIKIQRPDGNKYNLEVNDQLFIYQGDGVTYNYPKKEIVFNTGSQYKTGRIVIKLSPGEYNLKDIQVIFNSYKPYQALTKEKLNQSLQNVQFTEQSVSGTIKAQKEGILFLSIPYSEGWKVSVDGVSTKTLKTNTAFIGIPVSKGTHKIEMHYISPYFRLGVGVSIVTLTVLISVVVWRKRLSLRTMKNSNARKPLTMD